MIALARAHDGALEKVLHQIIQNFINELKAIALPDLPEHANKLDRNWHKIRLLQIVSFYFYYNDQLLMVINISEF